MRKFLRGKLHRVRVTEADVDYEGSITIDQALMEIAGLETHESVNVWNVTTGARIETYALPGGDGVICLNGAAAHRFNPGDIAIISWWRYGNEPEEPTVILVDPVTNLPKSFELDLPDDLRDEMSKEEFQTRLANRDRERAYDDFKNRSRELREGSNDEV